MWANSLDEGPFWKSSLAFMLGLAALMLLSPIQWTTGEGIPITIQSLLVVLIPTLIGWKRGTLAVILYLIAGGLGAPVFAYGTYGWARFTGSTGGFLMAFPLAAMLSGWSMEQRVGPRSSLIAIFILLFGQMLILALGLLWQRSIIPIEESAFDSIRRLLPGLMMKTAMGGLFIAIVQRISEQIDRRQTTASQQNV